MVSTLDDGRGRLLGAAEPARLIRYLTPAVVIIAAGCAALLPLNGDVRFQAGVEQTSPVPVAETFTHRPMLYRLIMAAVFAPSRLFGESSRRFEFGMQVSALLLCCLAGLLLYRALRDRGLPAGTAQPLAVAVAAAAGLQGAVSVWEPDWLALVLTVLAVAIGLLGRDDDRSWWPAAAGAGVLLAAAASIKIVTLPTALIGLVVLAVLAWRRAVAATVVATVAGLAWIGVIASLWPRELHWLIELSALQPPNLEPVWRTGLGLGSALLAWPVLIMLPAALGVLLAGRTARTRLRLGALAVLIMVLALLPAVVQQQFFIYHFVAFPVIAAAVLVLAVRRAAPTTAARLLIITVVAAMAAAVAIRLPAPLRVEHPAVVLAGLGLAMVLGVVLTLRGDRPTGSRPAAAAAVCCATMISIVAPGPTGTTPLTEVPQTGLINIYSAETTERRQDTGRRVRQLIGADTPVLYLAFGDVNYFVRNPTPCAYPAAVWLQRARHNPAVITTTGYAENLACLSDPAARFLVIDGSWFQLPRQPEPLRRMITDRYDCEDAPEIDGLLICPRR
ncbi:hypothetical protein [Microlunatus parietis]|uniref:4-amino-4-deoxy-L-arabinose transferase n=1 Tax=Microlunatus parietis TaxID=682979 RepID=A0A7Y9I467_9ACTN|nr:hypothetical protein [Microlunatus parietis]NYE69948.1 hypothetical protein [Microlunatus parietis]